MSNRFYGSVANKAELANTVYGSANGEAKRIVRLYGENNGTAKLIHQGFGHLDSVYGFAIFYTDNSHTTTDTVVLKTASDLSKLAGTSYSDNWSYTIDGKTVAYDNIKEVFLTSIVDVLPQHFLVNSSVLDSIDISQTKITYTPQNFLRNCAIFNQDITLPSTVRTIGNSNLSSCPLFNSNINIGNVTEIGTQFLSACYNFNKPLDTSNVDFINTYFLAAGSVTEVSKFNQPLDLGKLTALGGGFLSRCRSFDQDITFPSTLHFIGGSVMMDMRDMSHTVYCNTSTLPGKTGGRQLSFTTYLQDRETAPSYVNGIKLGGTYKNEWKAECPDVSGTDNIFRKTVVV